MNANERGELRAIVVYSLLLLFFFQLLSHFIAGIYGYGVLGTDLPVEMASLVLFLTPFLLIFFKRGLSHRTVLVIAILVAICRLVEVWLPLRWQLLAAGLGTGLFLFMFPALLAQLGQANSRRPGRLLAAALLLALSISLLLRVLGQTADISNEGMFRSITVVLAVGLILLLPGVILGRSEESAEAASAESSAGLGRVIVLALGIVSVFLLVYFAAINPEVISRWTGEGYALVMILSFSGLLGFSWITVLIPAFKGRGIQTLALILSAILVAALTVTLALNQVTLPSDPASYPLLDPVPGGLAFFAMGGLLLLLPVIAIDFGLLTGEITAIRPSMRQIGVAFGIASLFMMLMTLANVFTAVWAYVEPALEPLFRGRFWHIHLLVGLVLFASLLAVKSSIFAEPDGNAVRRSGRLWAVVVTGILIAAGVAGYLLKPSPKASTPGDRLLVAGYNLQQGYGVSFQRSHMEQCKLLREIDADVVAISENDTARVAGGNFDITHYLAACLDMHSYAGPKTATGSFGYAILSKYPIENPKTYHFYSDHGLPSSDDPAKTSGGDQVAVLTGEISAAGEVFTIISVHSDSNPPREQFDALVEIASAAENVIAIGDYNCRPGNQCFEIVDQELDHCVESSGNPSMIEGHIDHIFVSPNLECQNYSYIESDASDHPVVVSEISR